jgi:hypothetical protein
MMAYRLSEKGKGVAGGVAKGGSIGDTYSNSIVLMLFFSPQNFMSLTQLESSVRRMFESSREFDREFFQSSLDSLVERSIVEETFG